MKWIKNTFRKIKRGFNNSCIFLGYGALGATALSLILECSIFRGQEILILDGQDEPITPQLPFLGDQGVSSFYPIGKALFRAITDSHIKKVLINVEGYHWGVGEVQQIRYLIKRLQEAGKKVVGYGYSFGMAAGGILPYYTLSACGTKYMNHLGYLAPEGLSVQPLYWRKLLDFLKVRPQFIKKEEYKSGPNSYVFSQMPLEEKESWTTLLAQWKGQLVRDMSKDLGKKVAEVDTFIEGGRYQALEAVEQKFVNNLAVCFDQVVEKESANHEKVFVNNYVSKGSLYRKLARISHRRALAVVRIEGALGSQSIAEAERYFEAFSNIANNPSIKAVLVYVDSPGGSPKDAETLRYGMELCLKKNIPVVISMGNVAASAAYWISAQASKIWALPGTVTGSIGVYTGKFDVQELLKFFEVGTEKISTSKGKTDGKAESLLEPWSAEQKKDIERRVEFLYEHFLGIVSKNRKLPLSKVRQLAKGRIYTGQEALDHKLIDRLGGFFEALEDLKKEYGHNIPVYDYTPQNMPFFLRFLFSALSHEVQSRLSYFFKNSATELKMAQEYKVQ